MIRKDCTECLYEKGKNIEKRNWVQGRYILIFLFAFLSFLACIKCIFFGLNIDEEYAIVMAYRMLGEDGMFYTMWEPHQTSGFLCALFIKLFLMVANGKTDYLIIYLRVVGILLHAGVCIYVYFGLKNICSKYYSILLSILCFSILPKWILVPEFSNMMLWVTLGMMSFFLQIQYSESVRIRYFIIPGLLTCVGVLAYPSFLLCFIVYGVAIYLGVPGKRKQALVMYLLTCLIIGVAYILFFAVKLGGSNFIKGVMNMAMDGQHTTPLIEKLASNGLALGKCICIYVIIYAFVYLILRILKKDLKKGTFLGISMISILWQFLAWLGDSDYLYEPMVLFFHVFMIVVMSCAVSKKELLLYIFPPILTTFATSALTNTGISVVGVFLLPAIVYGLACLSNQRGYAVSVVVFSMLVLFLFAKGWLLCENGGYKADMNYVKQKALSGPAKNIYCRYLDGYEYNIVQELFDTYVPEGAHVLCVSGHVIWYLLGDVNISNYSTISTPTYDERLLEYYALFPEKYPDVIILQDESKNENIVELFNLKAPVVERDGIYLYYTSK